MTSNFSALLRQSTRLAPGIALLTAAVMATGCGVKFQAGDRIDLDGDGFFAMADPASYNAGLDINDDAARDAVRQQLLDLQLDCDDGNDDINPRASELCDGLDNDCDGFRDLLERDLDADGFTPCGVDPTGTDLIGADCNDARPPETVDLTSEESLLAFVAPFQNPSRAEYCGFPTPTLEQVPEWTRFGVIEIGGVSVRPSLGIDDDCDGELMSGEVDTDRDGHYRGCEAVLMDDPGTAPDLEDVLEVDCLDNVENSELIYPTVPASEARCTDFTNSDGLRVDTQCDPELTPNQPNNDDYEDDGIDWYADDDGDGDGDPNDKQNVCLGGQAEPGRIEASAAAGVADCNDQDVKLNSLDEDGDGFSSCDGDYRNGQSFDTNLPGNSQIYPGAPELCDGADNDLNGQVDDGFDGDGDGSFADTALSGTQCADYYGDAIDCNDADIGLNGNDVDNDGSSTCAGDCDDGNPGISQTDADGDGWFTCPTDFDNDGIIDGVDCDDSDPTLNQTNADQFDGTGAVVDPFSSCDGDCDDNNPNVGPHVAAECDGIDDTNCDGVFDPLEVDNDGDGSTECAGDCDDANASLNLADADGDNVTTCAGDCDDAAVTVFPGAPALCDGITDNDCNGAEDANEADWDNDLYITCPGTGTLPTGIAGGGDCDDTDAELVPVDQDGDGVSTCDGDCDGTNGALSPNIDADGDGWSTCPAGLQPADCDDTNPGLNQSDSDNDADSTCSGDCDDTDPTLNTNDADGDGVDTCDGDCNDGVGGTSQRPAAGTVAALAETRDGIDNDCDGTADEGLLSAGNIAIVEMMISGSDQVGDSAAEYIEVINTTGVDIDLRGLVVSVVNVVPDPNNLGSTTTNTQSYSLGSDPDGMPLTVVSGTADLVALGRSAAIDGANLVTTNPNATYSFAGTGYSWEAPLLSDLGGTITLSHGGQTLDIVTWFASGWDPTCNGGNGCYNLNQDAGAALDRSRWRPGRSMGLASFVNAAVANNTASSWCEEQTVQGSNLFGTPAAPQGTVLCN